MSSKRLLNQMTKRMEALELRDVCQECKRHTCWVNGGLAGVYKCRQCKPVPVFIESATPSDPPCAACGYFNFRIPFNIGNMKQNAI